MWLKIYIAENCWGCDEAREIAAQIAAAYPPLSVQVIDLNGADVDKPDEVFATPTYMLNGRVVSLGNPSFAALRALVEAELQAQS